MDQPSESIQQISVEELQANPLQPRGVITPESLVDLVDSIKVHGILEPLVVAETPAGLQIIAGERRWRAAKIAGLKTVPCIVRETTPRGMLEMALVEKITRADIAALFIEEMLLEKVYRVKQKRTYDADFKTPGEVEREKMLRTVTNE